MRAKPDAPRLPLLERFGAHGHGRSLDGAGLRYSVAQELARLLNTRAAGPANATPGAALTIVDYGIPDWSSSYTASVEDRERLARDIERAVRAFEPRLLAPRVQMALHPAGLRQLQVRIEGRLRFDGAAHHVSYAVAMDGAGAALTRAWEPA